MTRPLLRLMTRKACCLCEDAERVLHALEQEGLCRVECCDVDLRPAWAARYGRDVPVLLDADDSPRLMHQIDADAVRRLLAAMASS